MILLVLAIFLAIVLFPIGFSVAMFYPKRGKYMYKIALGIDQLGNVVCKHLFNITLIKKDGYKFGNEDETISSVIGKNKVLNKLTYTGMLLSMLLDAIDENHSIKSIEADENKFG
jgi:8-oxo-dGTP diphosphatase